MSVEPCHTETKYFRARLENSEISVWCAGQAEYDALSTKAMFGMPRVRLSDLQIALGCVDDGWSL